MTVFTASETSSRNAQAAQDREREEAVADLCPDALQRGATALVGTLGGGSIFQMMLSASCNCEKIPIAPNEYA